MKPSCGLSRKGNLEMRVQRSVSPKLSEQLCTSAHTNPEGQCAVASSQAHLGRTYFTYKETDPGTATRPSLWSSNSLGVGAGKGEGLPQEVAPVSHWDAVQASFKSV